MFGFIVGTASLVGLIAVLRKERYGGWRHGPGRGGKGAAHGGRRRWMLRWLYQRLDTTPGQEKVLAAAAEDMEARLRQMYSELEQLRKEAGRSLRGSQFDASAIRESFARQRAHLETLEESVVGHLGRGHEALDEAQRERLAELVQDGPRRSMRACLH
jgi:septal ring factor EnvC (AmiA/AmiB activator)